jgi:hypothetical protein
MKTCSKCSVRKELTEFSKCKKAIDGLQYDCKLCQKQRSKQNYLKDPKHHAQVISNWKKRNYEKSRQYQRNFEYKKQGIYEWYEGDTSLYVGQSTRLNQRLLNHKSYFNNPELAKKEAQSYLYPLLRQHQNPQIRIIEECSPEALLEREQYYIDTKKPLYNRDI